MTRATVHFQRPAGATAHDPHTLATPHWGEAWRTCERTGPAFQVTDGPPLWWRFGAVAFRFLAAVGFVGLVFVGLACAHGG